MSSIAKTSISLSKKDLQNSRHPLIATRNIVFYHKASSGDFSIDLNNLTMPSSEMPSQVQATSDQIAAAKLFTFKNNLELISVAKGPLVLGLDYLVADSYTINLIGPYDTVGTEADEIFIGKINSSPMSDLTAVSTQDVVKTYTLGIGETTLNLAQEYDIGVNPLENIGSMKIWVNGVLALRDIDYVEVEAGTTGKGSTIEFLSSPVTIPWQIVVDYGVRAITDTNAIGTIESLSGAVKKIADDLAVVAGTDANDYLNANPSEIERRAYGDMVLAHDALLDQVTPITTYTKTKVQTKVLSAAVNCGVGASVLISDLTFNNLTVGKTYRLHLNALMTQPGGGGSSIEIKNASTALGSVRRFVAGISSNSSHAFNRVFVATGSNITFTITDVTTGTASVLNVSTNDQATFAYLEELPNHEFTTQWT